MHILDCEIVYVLKFEMRAKVISELTDTVEFVNQDGYKL